MTSSPDPSHDADFGLTPQQRQALAMRRASVALSAGAGCGKTFVLTQRFLSHLEPRQPGGARPARLGELVAITFTERAAREMRDRIRQACHQRLLAADEADVPHWLGLVRELDAARISTIHSFCASLLRAHAVEAGVDPHFRVLEQTQADTMLHELIGDCLRRRLEQADEKLVGLVVDFGLEQLYDMVRTLLGQRHAIDWSAWRAMAPEDLAARWERCFHQQALPRILRGVAECPAARTIRQIAEGPAPEEPKLAERFAVLAERLAGLASSRDPAGDLAAIRAEARVQGVAEKKWPSKQVYQTFREAATELRGAIDAAARWAGFQPEQALPAAESSLAVLDLAGQVAAAYAEEKRACAGLDFDDLLIEAARLLDGPGGADLRHRLSSQIRELLVDEFQDTDPLQVGLIRSLCGDGLLRGKLFFVGDYKQSIYRFRGADPHVFQELRRALPEEGRLPLTLNFRSQPAVLDFVNALFCEALGPQYEPLAAERPQRSPTPAVELLWAPDDEPKTRRGQKERLRRREADWIARRIRGLLDSPEPIVLDYRAAEPEKSSLRRVQPRDVALLFRALSDVRFYEEALRRYGIDYYLVGGHAFYAQQEIYDLLSLLRAVAVPGDDVSLAGALRSPFFSLHDETLYWLAQHEERLRGGLFSGAVPKELDRAQRRRVEFARHTLEEIRRDKDRRPIAEVIDLVLERTGYDAALLAEHLGERKLANLRKLVDQARAMDRAGIFTLSDFITQLSEFVARQPDEPLAATHPEATNVVRLMTIHQSKGLEFPVVVIPDVDRAMRGSRDQVAFTPELGPMVKPPDTEATVGLDLHRQAEGEEDRAETVRLFYVAATRAADRLILSSGVPEQGKPGPWRELLGTRFDLATGALIADLPAGYAVPDLRVITDEPETEVAPHAARRGRDLEQMADQAEAMASRSAGRLPPWLAPVPPDRSARRQFSFSRLSGMLHARPAVTAPAETDDEADGAARIDPLGLGTLVHAVLAELDLARPDEIEPLVRRHAPRHLPDDPQAVAEAVELIGRFARSSRAEALRSARQVLPEVEFLLAWPSGAEASEGRYLQGFIDALYEDAQGRWHVLDYKTNRVSERTLAAVAAGYEMQMLVYGLAVEEALGQAPCELVLHFLRPGREHAVAWDPGARSRLGERVDRALAEGGREAGSG